MKVWMVLYNVYDSRGYLYPGGEKLIVLFSTEGLAVEWYNKHKGENGYRNQRVAYGILPIIVWDETPPDLQF